jgi:hypothetical protein
MFRVGIQDSGAGEFYLPHVGTASAKDGASALGVFRIELSNYLSPNNITNLNFPFAGRAFVIYDI